MIAWLSEGRRGRTEEQRRGTLPLLPPLFLSFLLPILLFAACSPGGPAASGDRLAVDLDKSNEERLLRYYLGGYVAPGGADPAEAGLLLTDGGLALDPARLALDPARLDARYREHLTDANGDGTLDWDEFVAFVEATYYDARGLPRSLDALKAEAGFDPDSGWFAMEVDGVMTAARRRVFVPVAALRAALDGYRAAGDELHYPEGTVFIGEHLVADEVAETTVKRRRADGFWDFAVYDAEGRLAGATATEPRPLRAPEQCVGCHLGRRLFDPEKSFPAPAPDGPYGPRAVHAPSPLRNAEAAAFFDEHAKRSDGVLGLYATLYVSRLIADRDEGVLAPEDAALLDALGL